MKKSRLYAGFAAVPIIALGARVYYAPFRTLNQIRDAALAGRRGSPAAVDRFTCREGELARPDGRRNDWEAGNHDGQFVRRIGPDDDFHCLNRVARLPRRGE
jgi:hypothetical protein